MSAFIVGNDHIDALLTYTIDHKGSFYDEALGQRVYVNEDHATEIGKILMAENERSIRHRYDDNAVDEMAGGETATQYKFRRWTKPLKAVEVLKGCNCFDYQACETDDYSTTKARKIIDEIRGLAIRGLPGYDDAQGWEFRRSQKEKLT